MRFWLGTHMPGWVWDERLAGVDLFVSRRTLSKVKRPRAAVTDWALDSGGFSELSMYGRWTISAKQYAAEVAEWSRTPGRLSWAACMDWMVEPDIRAKTGQTVADHQRRTIDSYHELRALDSSLPWTPVLQGWAYGDYWEHVAMYERAGVDLRSLPVVGVGSVCRRQDTAMAEELMRDLSRAGIRPHGFGFKFGGLVRAGRCMASADSLAWSLNARKHDPLPWCTHSSCANCHKWALRWRERLLAAVAKAGRRPESAGLFD